MLLLSVALISCIAVFAACNKDEETNDGTVTITVKYPDGTPVNGHTDGKNWDNDTETNTNVRVQFCIAPGQGFEGCNTPATLGEDGTIKLNILEEALKGITSLDGFTADSKIELHILFDSTDNNCGYKKDGYGTFTQNTFPSKLDVTLVENS